MLYMSSQMGNDGSYTLTVTFDIGTDLNTALVMVQNRVQLAMPLLPPSVQNQGITIRKKTPDILNVISFYSPDGRYDDVYLSNYATIHVYDELLRIDGVSQINFLGVGNYSMRGWLDPQKLASLNMSAIDVANAIRSQNLDAPAGQIGQPPTSRGQPFQLPIDTLGRLTDPEQCGDEQHNDKQWDDEQQYDERWRNRQRWWNDRGRRDLQRWWNYEWRRNDGGRWPLHGWNGKRGGDRPVDQQWDGHQRYRQRSD